MAHDRHVYDVVVVGGGPAGLAAAWEAAQTDARVALVESSPWLGGQIWKDTPDHPVRGQGRHWLQRIRQTSVDLLTQTTVVGTPETHTLLTETPTESRRLHWHKLILATGARERFIPFPGWTLPQVMGVGGLQTLAKSAWPVRDQRVVVAGTGPLLLALAAELKMRGARVQALIEQACWRSVATFGTTVLGHMSKLLQGIALAPALVGIPRLMGWWPLEARGQDHVEEVVITNGRKSRTLNCDILACAFGLVPNRDLPELLSLACNRTGVQIDEQQRSSRPDIYVAGELTGVAGVEGALVEGRIAGLCATNQLNKARGFFGQRRKWQRFAEQLARAFQLRDELKTLVTNDTVICRCEDVTWGSLKEHGSWVEAKLQCRCGMGNCQGRVCGDALDFLMGWQATGKRPPLLPVRLETLRSSS